MKAGNLWKFLKKHKKYSVYGGILLAVAVLFLVFSIHNKNKNKPVYITDSVKRQSIQRTVNASGEVRALDLVTVGAQASGKIEKLYVEVGQEVKEGDLIAEIDSTTQQNDVDTSKAKVSSFKSQLEAARISLEIARKQYVRLQELKTQNAASAEELENSQNTYQSAQSNVIQIESSLQEAQIALSTAQTNLGYTKITAPLSGTIVSIPVKQGQTVNAAMNTPTIVQIADLSSMEILIEISEGDIIGIKPGLPVTYAILANINDTRETTLNSIDPGLTLLSQGTYTGFVSSSEAIYYYGRLIVPNGDGKLRIGMTTQNEIFVEQAEDVLTVPLTAIKENGKQKYVQVLVKKKVERRNIETGISDGLNVEVRSGISEGDSIIIAQATASEISGMTSATAGQSRD